MARGVAIDGIKPRLQEDPTAIQRLNRPGNSYKRLTE